MKPHVVLVFCLLLSACNGTGSAPAIQTAATPTATTALTNTPIPPTATLTLTPPPTPTGAATRDPNLILADNFSGRCNLAERDTDQATYQCENGEYTIVGKTATARWVYYRAEQSDYVLQADAHVLLGSDLTYGLVFRVSADGQSFYAFLLAPDGTFSVYRYQDKFTALQTRAPSAAIRLDTGLNHLKVVVQGNQWALYVNDQWLNTFTDSVLAGGSFGFIVTNGEPNVKVAFGNLRVSKLTAADVIPLPSTPSPLPTSPADLSLNADADGQSIALQVNQTLAITLVSNSSTGYRWKLVTDPDPSILTLLSSDYRAPVPQPSRPPLAGAGGVEVWRFAAVGVGATQLKLSYVGPSPGSAPGGDFAIRVRVN